MKIDWKLKGWNLLKFGCNTNSIVHPETCTDVVKVGHDSEKTLTEWITGDGQSNLEDSLSTWIANNLLSSSDNQIQVNATWHSEYQSLSYSQTIGYIGSNSSNIIEIPLVNSGSSLFGLSRAGSGLNASNGVYSVALATNNSIGGIQLGYYTPNENPTYKPVQLDTYGKAFVDVGNTGHVINQWGPSTTISYSSPVYVAFPTTAGTIFTSLNLLSGGDGRAAMDTYFESLPTSWSSGFGYNRIFPIMCDTQGVWYTYVPYPNAPSVFNTMRNGLVPMSNTVGDTSKFLKGDGTWAVPQGTIYSQFNTTTSGLVPAASSAGATTKFLRGDGTWQTPQNTTYEVALGIDEKRIGLLELHKDVSNVSDVTFATPAETTTTIIPVVYSNSENNTGHGISLETLMTALIADTDLMTALKEALAAIE